ncbi:hypothetical protein [Kitasatospora nipponensis]|uniref:hypothetical protein n=1 Tax=Kitasatospora nipponensis TaxID=258049 RepID=UPI0031DACA22
MADKGRSGSGSSGGAGAGYRVEVDNLRAFAGQVRGLLAEFQTSADGPTTHARTGVGRGSFGPFAEAVALHDQYDLMRDGLRDVLTALHEAIDEAQQKADLTATNYEEQEHRTAQRLKVGADGWSVGTPGPSVGGSPTTYGAAAAGTAAGALAGRAAARNAAVDRAGNPVEAVPATAADGTRTAAVPGAVPGAVGPGGGVPGGAGKGNTARPTPGPGTGTGADGDGDTGGGAVVQPTW